MPQVERTCPRCQIVFVPGKLEGSCPACLFADTVDFINDDDGTLAFWEDKPAAAASPGRGFSHFELLDELGRGGMGTVYRARDRATGRIVALKVLQAHHLFEVDLVQRFRSEVRAISSLDHRHILPIHEVGEYDGVPFFSMKLASGGSLAQRLNEYVGHPRRTAQLLVKVIRGVQHAHERGILHRDLKPGNILLDEADEPYVCDFGLAKWMEDDRRLTLTSVVLGTPHYIAPEQASGKPGTLTIAADIYSLGAILYELLTGRPPFIGETAFDTLRQASQNSPAKPSSIVNGTPRDLETICLKAIEREPAARYATAAAFADDLDHWLAGRPIRARPVGAAEQLWRWARRNPLPATLSATLIAALVTLAVSTSIAAIKIDRSRDRAVAAEQDAKEKLSDSIRAETRASAAEQEARGKLRSALLAQAKASRMTGLAGYRAKALTALKQAAAIEPNTELRNEAIAALCLVDLEERGKIKVRNNNGLKLAFDATLQTAAVATETGDINIVSLKDGSLKKTIKGNGLRFNFLAHSGSRFVATLTDDRILSLWDIEAGKLVRQFANRSIFTQRSWLLLSFAFSPDETRLATVSAGGIEIIDLATGGEIARLQTASHAGLLAFNATGRQLAFANNAEKNISVWNFGDGESVKTIPLMAEPSAIAWCPDSSKLAVACFDSSIHILQTVDWQSLGSLSGHGQPVAALAFSHDGNLIASTAFDQTVRLWDARTMSALTTLAKHGGVYANIEFSPDDKYICTTDTLFSASFFAIVGLNQVCTTFTPIAGAERNPLKASISYSSDSTLLATSSSKVVQIFDAKKGLLLSTLSTRSLVQTLHFLPKGHTLAVMPRQNGLTFYQLSYRNGKLEAALDKSRNGLFPDHRFASNQYSESPLVCLISQKIKSGVIWNTVTNQEVRTFVGESSISDIVVSPDEKWFVTSYMTRDVHKRQSAQWLLEKPSSNCRKFAGDPSPLVLAGGGWEGQEREENACCGMFRHGRKKTFSRRTQREDSPTLLSRLTKPYLPHPTPLRLTCSRCPPASSSPACHNLCRHNWRTRFVSPQTAHKSPRTAWTTPSFFGIFPNYESSCMS